MAVFDTFIDRRLNACSSVELLNKELNFLKRFAFYKSYSCCVIDNTLNKLKQIFTLIFIIILDVKVIFNVVLAI